MKARVFHKRTTASHACRPGVAAAAVGGPIVFIVIQGVRRVAAGRHNRWGRHDGGRAFAHQPPYNCSAVFTNTTAGRTLPAYT
jgi:hypothetical protein